MYCAADLGAPKEGTQGMKTSLKLAASAAAIMLVAAGGALAAGPAKPAAAKPSAPAKAAAHHAPGKAGVHAAASRTRDPARLGGHPNLNGIWQVMNTANWDLEPHEGGQALVAPEKVGAIGAIPPGLGVVEGGTIPYLPAALEQREANRKTAPAADPEAACYLPGIPRASYMPYPFQIIQGDSGDMLMAYEYDAANRTIYIQKTEQPPIDTWMGTSYGQWEGDTLVVTTLGQNGMTWMDRKGDYLSPDAKVTERFRMVDHDHISYQATVEDKTLYSRPWTISMPLYRNVEPRAEILDFRCVPFADLLVYGDLVEGVKK